MFSFQEVVKVKPNDTERSTAYDTNFTGLLYIVHLWKPYSNITLLCPLF